MCYAATAQEADSITVEASPEYMEEENENSEDEAEVVVIAPSELEQTKNYKEEKIHIQKFDKKQWKKIVGNTSYNEKKKEKEKEKEKDEKKSTSISSPWSGPILTVIFYVVIIAIVLLILWSILKNVSLDMKLKKNADLGDDAANIENIEVVDIDSFLKKARAEKNYRLAIRLYYLGLLKRLNETGAINWKKDKTNLDYLTELFTRDYHYSDIKRVTLAYEEVWYGERVLTDDTFAIVSQSFENIFSKLNPAQGQ
jgi:hypothetical protein